MDLASDLDRLGSDHAIRRRMRDFLTVRYGYELDGSVFSLLADGKVVPATKVKPEIDRLIAIQWTHNDVYTVTADDLADFARYADEQISIERALSQISRSARLALEAGISHRDFQLHAVRMYEAHEAEELKKAERAEAKLQKDADTSPEP